MKGETIMKKLPFVLLLLTAISFWGQLSFAQSNIKWEDTWDIFGAPPEWRVINYDSSTGGSDGFDAWFFTGSVTQDNVTIQPQAGQVFAVSSWIHANAAGHIDEYLVSPQIQGIEQGDSLHFYAGATDGSFKDSLRVFVSTTGRNRAGFTNQIAYFKIDGPTGTWHKYSFDLSPFAGSDIYFAVNYYIVDCGPNGTHASQPYVDHFVVTSSMATSVEPPSVVEDFALGQNYPNPFNPSTTINYSVEQAGKVELKIYNMLGQVVRTLLQGSKQAGDYSVVWDGKDDLGSEVASGLYVCKLVAGDFQSTRNMVFLK